MSAINETLIRDVVAEVLGRLGQGQVPSPAPPAREPGSPVAVEPLSLAQIGLDPSRVVPRPDLLGTLVEKEKPAEPSSRDR